MDQVGVKKEKSERNRTMSNSEIRQKFEEKPKPTRRELNQQLFEFMINEEFAPNFKDYSEKIDETIEVRERYNKAALMRQ